MQSSKYVLYVDDDSDDREIFLEVLQAANPGCGSLLANNGMEALNLLSQLSTLPLCIFADLNMPRLNGLELLAALKADERFSGIPIFILSTSNHQKFQREAKLLGADGYYTKPNSYQQYHELLKMSLSHFLDTNSFESFVTN